MGLGLRIGDTVRLARNLSVAVMTDGWIYMAGMRMGSMDCAIMHGCLLSGGDTYAPVVHGGCGGCLVLHGWLTSGASGLSNSNWLRTDVYNGDHGALSKK